jgi:hypothetical protein
VVQPALVLIPCVTPTRNETVPFGATTKYWSGAAPKKSCVVRVEVVGSGCPALSGKPVRVALAGTRVVKRESEQAVPSRALAADERQLQSGRDTEV